MELMPVVRIESNEEDMEEPRQQRSNVDVVITENIEDDIDDIGHLEPDIVEKDIIPRSS